MNDAAQLAVSSAELPKSILRTGLAAPPEKQKVPLGAFLVWLVCKVRTLGSIRGRRSRPTDAAGEAAQLPFHPVGYANLSNTYDSSGSRPEDS